MTDLTEAQRIERGRRAQMALDEFLDPALDALIAVYSARIEEIAATQPWEAGKITALANATRIARQVRSQIMGLVHDGDTVRQRKDRAAEIEKLSPAKRRFLDMVPH
jgi:hypothetical protein